MKSGWIETRAEAGVAVVDEHLRAGIHVRLWDVHLNETVMTSKLGSPNRRANHSLVQERLGADVEENCDPSLWGLGPSRVFG